MYLHDKLPSSNNTNTNSSHVHDYQVVKSNLQSSTDDVHTTLNGTHAVRCTICGDEYEEEHHFDTWWTLYDGTAWTLWCQDCSRYVYTSDYNVVQNSGYPLREESESTEILY